MHARSPRELHAAFLRAFNGGDLEAIVALYEPGATFAPSAAASSGRQAGKNPSAVDSFAHR